MWIVDYLEKPVSKSVEYWKAAEYNFRLKAPDPSRRNSFNQNIILNFGSVPKNSNSK